MVDYEALINVETNNMAVIQPATSGSKPYIEELGDNRGVIIKIDKSNFKHSRFCKGMLVFKNRPILDSSFDYLVYGLANNN